METRKSLVRGFKVRCSKFDVQSSALECKIIMGAVRSDDCRHDDHVAGLAALHRLFLFASAYSRLQIVRWRQTSLAMRRLEVKLLESEIKITRRSDPGSPRPKTREGCGQGASEMVGAVGVRARVRVENPRRGTGRFLCGQSAGPPAGGRASGAEHGQHALREHDSARAAAGLSWGLAD